MFQLTENWRNSLRIFLALLSLAGLQALLTMHLRMRFEPVADSTVQASEQLNPVLFQSMSFAQLPAAIDWVWLKVLQDPSMEHVKRGEHLQIYYDLDLLTTLDPMYYGAYVVGANSLAVLHDDGIGALDLLLKGEKFRKEELPQYGQEFRERFWKTEWAVPLLLGYTYLFELDDMPHAATAYEEAANISGSPSYLQKLARRFRQPGGQYEVGLRLTEFLITTQHDPRMKERLEKRKTSLVVAQYVFDTNEKFQSYLSPKKISLRKPTTQEDVARLRKYWREFLRQSNMSDSDPWGGILSVDDSGRLMTSTPHQVVFGLDD